MSIKLKHIKRHIRKLLKLKSREIRIDHFPWTKSGELHRKFVIADSSVVELVVNESQRTFAVVNLPSCLGESRLEAFESDQLEKEPEFIPESKLPPEYPPDARQLRMDGLAVIHGIIRSDGRITDLCSVIEIPAGFGFAESALEAISQWRWKPGRIEDEAVDTLHSITAYWSLD
ncbi:MAG: energy transducer TonB [bacterium]|nr:energy transducer TonB [bacterium]